MDILTIDQAFFDSISPPERNDVALIEAYLKSQYSLAPNRRDPQVLEQVVNESGQFLTAFKALGLSRDPWLGLSPTEFKERWAKVSFVSKL